MTFETFGNVGRFGRLAVTVPEANVTYDAQIHYFVDNLGIEQVFMDYKLGRRIKAY